MCQNVNKPIFRRLHEGDVKSTKSVCKQIFPTLFANLISRPIFRIKRSGVCTTTFFRQTSVMSIIFLAKILASAKRRYAAMYDTTTDGFARMWTGWRLVGVRSGCGTSTHCGRRLIRSATQRSRACCGHADDDDNSNNYHLTSTCINRDDQNFTCDVRTARKQTEKLTDHTQFALIIIYLQPKLNCTDLLHRCYFSDFIFILQLFVYMPQINLAASPLSSEYRYSATASIRVYTVCQQFGK